MRSCILLRILIICDCWDNLSIRNCFSIGLWNFYGIVHMVQSFTPRKAKHICSFPDNRISDWGLRIQLSWSHSTFLFRLWLVDRSLYWHVRECSHFQNNWDSPNYQAFWVIIYRFYFYRAFGYKSGLSIKDLLFIAYAGMIRGAVAFGLVLRIDQSIPNRSVIVTSSLVLVIISTVFMGSTVSTVQRILFGNLNKKQEAG